MPSSAPASDGSGLAQAELVKVLDDLNAIVEALLSALSPTKPWQRQLIAHLVKLDREVQVARMTVAMGRDPLEVREAVAASMVTVRVAYAFVAGGRADMGTKAAVRLVFELGQKMDRLLPS